MTTQYQIRIVVPGQYMLVTTQKQLDVLCKQCKMRSFPLMIDGAHAVTHCVTLPSGRFCVVAIKSHSDPKQIASMLCHEAYHVWNHLSADMGPSLRTDEEFVAHCLQQITFDLLGEYKKQVKK